MQQCLIKVLNAIISLLFTENKVGYWSLKVPHSHIDEKIDENPCIIFLFQNVIDTVLKDAVSMGKD